jgi:uncharacterized protein YacL
MSKAWKRRLLAVLVFLIFTGIYYAGSGDLWVILYGSLAALIMVALDKFFYSKRGIFLYSLLGLIAGFYSGQFLFSVFAQIAPIFFTVKLSPYFILFFMYTGFTLPLLASQKHGYALNFPFGSEGEKKSTDIKLLDTSVVIDGRIADIADTGFISGTLILPKFVLNEIQSLADSKDPIKRSRARRGLDVLNKLKETQSLDLKIYSRDFPEVKGVDAKLISLAKEMSASIITNDYNLNKVAQLDSIPILNLNDLANALKPVLLPGEEMELDVLKEGKENNQGLGYLPDGTMVVVANGLSLIGKRIPVKVTSILQTSAGRIVFTEPKK